MSDLPDLDAVRNAYARDAADDGYWHYEDYLEDLKTQRKNFDAWLEAYVRDKQDIAWLEGMRTGHALYCQSQSAEESCPRNFEVPDSPYYKEV